TTEERLAIVRRARKLGLAGDYTVSPGRLSGDVLAGLGIRGLPARITDWWQKVKTGELAFTFIGQNVEYRFNPDVTCETTPISVVDDPAHEIPGALEIPEEEKATTMEAEAEEMPKQKPFWAWLA